MARPRKHNLHLNLPVGIYFSHGSYYKVTRGVWYRLGKTLEESCLARLPSYLSIERCEVLAYTNKVLTAARNNAKQRKVVGFDLAREDVHRMLNEAGWCCAVTGMPFNLEVINGRKPFAPSIDRIDCAVGYFPHNCRVVCLCVNYAMNVWGEDVFRRMLKGLKRQSIGRSNMPLGEVGLNA